MQVSELKVAVVYQPEVPEFAFKLPRVIAGVIQPLRVFVLLSIQPP